MAPVTTPAEDMIDSLSNEKIKNFKRDGFTFLSRLIDAQTLETLRDYYEKIIRQEMKLPGDRQLGGVTRQVMNMRQHLPYFADNPALQAGLQIASSLLGGSPVELCFDMLIYKPPLHPKATPWHQDFAYNDMPFTPEGTPIQGGGVQFWVPLDDVDFDNGCMHFLPGQHTQPLKAHYVYAGAATDPARLLATSVFGDADLPNAGIACPLPAGGCTIHDYGTPHYTPPNITMSRGRRAYIFNVRMK